MNHYDKNYFQSLRNISSKFKNFDVLDFNHLEESKECFFTKKSNIQMVENYYCDVFNELHDDQIREMTCFLDKTVVKKVEATSIVVDMFLNTHNRFHRFEKRIPRNVFDVALYVYSYDKRPYLFLNDDWVDRFWNSSFTAYVFIDLVGFKEYMKKNIELDREKLEKINQEIDRYIEGKKGLSVISVSDSVILKKNFGIRDAYEQYTPEELVYDSIEIRKIFKDNLGLDSYAIFTQGFNEYSSKDNFHIGAGGNHVSMLSSGSPYVDMFDIELSASQNLKSKIHSPYSCYFHEDFFLSMNFKFSESDWRANVPRYRYNSRSTMMNAYIALNEFDFLDKFEGN